MKDNLDLLFELLDKAKTEDKKKRLENLLELLIRNARNYGYDKANIERDIYKYGVSSLRKEDLTSSSIEMNEAKREIIKMFEELIKGGVE
jgi:hypothetical protein